MVIPLLILFIYLLNLLEPFTLPLSPQQYIVELQMGVPVQLLALLELPVHPHEKSGAMLLNDSYKTRPVFTKLYHH